MLDEITVAALQHRSTDELLAIADYRDSVYPGGWMATMIRQYVEVWR
jgi:hypothetical protein